MDLLDSDPGNFYISIHAPREGGDAEQTGKAAAKYGISIHAPREGGDECRVCGYRFTPISIHAPREGGDSGASSS